MKIVLADKVLHKLITEKDFGEFITPSDEAEAIAIAGGYWLATGKKAEVYISADGFMNTLNFITSWVIPEKIGMHLIISIGRTEPSHIVATEITPDILRILETYDNEKFSYELINKNG